jgi:hypothetical protein
MSNPYGNGKQFLLYQLKWMGIYVGIAFAITWILPFPIDLVVALGAFLFLNFLRTRSMLKRAGIDNMKGWFRLLRSSYSSSMYGEGYYTPIKYYCMGCGKEHKEIACPNCGSKMKRVG